ncbi:MAG: hypothetical protein QM598_09760 [Protaetiibacter sp.]
MLRAEQAGTDQPPRVREAGSVRESLQLFGLLSTFLGIVVAFVLFARLDPNPSSFPVQFDVDPARFSERLRQAAVGTEPHIGWLLGISVAFLAGSFVATLTRHSWTEGDRAAQRVGLFSVSISALAFPFVLLLIAGSFLDEGLLPVALISAFTFFIVALLAIYVGRFASMTVEERFARLESDIEEAQSRSRALSLTRNWKLSAVVGVSLAVAASVIAGLAVLAFAGVWPGIAEASAIALILAAVASVVALTAFAVAVGFQVARDLYTRILLASIGLGTVIVSVLALWLRGEGDQRLVDLTLTIAIGVPVLSASLPRRLGRSRLTAARAARDVAARLLELRARRLVRERDLLLRAHSPFVSR